MPLIDIVKPLKANTIAIERANRRVFGAFPWSPVTRAASARLAAELTSSGAGVAC